MNAQEFTQAVARRWIARRTEQQLKIKTVAHAKAQLEFFIGAYAAAEITGQPYGSMSLMLLAIGRDSAELLPKETT